MAGLPARSGGDVTTAMAGRGARMSLDIHERSPLFNQSTWLVLPACFRVETNIGNVAEGIMNVEEYVAPDD